MRIKERVFPGLEMIALFLIGWFILSITWKIPFHQYQLWKMQRNFRSQMRPVHPKESNLIAEVREFHSSGMSNHCDYLVGEFRSTMLSKEAVLHAYAGVVTSSFIGNRLVETDVYFSDEDIFMHDPWDKWLEKYLPDHSSLMHENAYLIFSSDDGNSPEGDIRCH